MNKRLYILAVIITGMVSATVAAADVKIKTRQTMGGQSYESTTYIKGKRQRSESINGMMISLTQCDLRRGVQLNSQTKTFTVNSFADASQEASSSLQDVDKNGVVQAGGRVTTTVTIKDTGERKQMFGFTARRLVITMQTVSSADACSPTNTKMQTEGWYIDAAFVLDCDYGNQNYNNYNARNGGCRDKYEMKTVGTGKRGYPVYEKMTMFDESGNETYSMVSEVMELSKATLDASLFDIPADYREVSDPSQMYAAATQSASNLPARSSETTASGVADSIRTASAQTANSASSALPSAKLPGVIRIGLAGIKTGQVGEGITASDLAAAVQTSLISFLKVPNMEVVALDARLTSAVAAEARQKDCDFVVYASVSHKKGGGGGFGGMFGQALGSAIGRTGIGHTGSTAGNIAGQVATNAIVSATSVSANVKSKDEITLDLRLDQRDGGTALSKIYKAKAKSNGDDIISQVVEQAAQAIVDVLGK